jgi:hypothetical protein
VPSRAGISSDLGTVARGYAASALSVRGVKLLVAFWRYVDAGIVPEGATLKAIAA